MIYKVCNRRYRYDGFLGRTIWSFPIKAGDVICGPRTDPRKVVNRSLISFLHRRENGCIIDALTAQIYPTIAELHGFLSMAAEDNHRQYRVWSTILPAVPEAIHRAAPVQKTKIFVPRSVYHSTPLPLP